MLKNRKKGRSIVRRVSLRGFNIAASLVTVLWLYPYLLNILSDSRLEWRAFLILFHLRKNTNMFVEQIYVNTISKEYFKTTMLRCLVIVISLTV